MAEQNQKPPRAALPAEAIEFLVRFNEALSGPQAPPEPPEALIRQLRELGAAQYELFLRLLEQDRRRVNLAQPVLPGYEVIKELGRGGMGVVYRARQVGTDRLVALKTVLMGQHASPEQRVRFRVEVETVAALDHPNIIPLYEVGEHGGVPYFAMKLVEGDSLAGLVPDLRLDPRRAAELLALVARAVHHAHQRGVIHRDLKPANVLIGNDGTPYVSDFGLARRGEGAGSITGQIIGTPPYMAPEQLRGEKALTVAVDVWALGAMLYECLTGRPPFGDGNVLKLAEAVTYEEPAPAGGDLGVIALKCLQKEPHRRYGSAAELADDLRRWLDGEPILARPAGALERMALWCRRNPWATALIGVLSVAVLACSVLARWAWAESGRAEEAAGLARRNEGKAKESARSEARQASAARRSEKKAREQEKLANEQRDKARARQAYAEQQWGRAEKLLHTARVESAQREWGLGRPWAAASRLAECRIDMRGWECRYLAAAFTQNQVLLHEGVPVVGVGLTDDGRVAWAGAKKEIRAWSLDTGRCLRVLHAPGNGISLCSIAFSQDGRFIACSDYSGGLFLQNAATGKVVLQHNLDKKDKHYSAVTFSPKGDQFVACSNDDRVTFWDIKQARRVRTLVAPKPIALAFRPDGERLAVASDVGGVIVFEKDDSKVPGIIKAPYINSIAYSPDGHVIACGCLKSVQLWKMTGSAPERLAEEPASDFVRQVAFSPDGLVLAAGGGEGEVSIRSPSTGKELRAFRGHSSITSLAFTADGRHVLSGGWDGKVILWEADGRQGPSRQRAISGFSTALAFTPDGQHLLVAGQAFGLEKGRPPLQGVVMSQSAPGNSPFVLKLAAGKEARGLAVCPSGKRFAVTTTREYSAHDLHSGKLLYSGPLDGWDAPDVAFSPDGLLLACLGSSSVLLVDAASGKQVRSWKETGASFKSLAWAPDGKSLFTACRGGPVIRWDVSTGKNLGRWLVHDGGAWCVAVSPTGGWVASGGADGVVRLRDVNGRLPPIEARGHSGKVLGIDFSPDGKRLVSCGDDKAVRLWDVPSGLPVLTLRVGTRSIPSVRFSPDGTRVVSTAGGDVTAWEAPVRHNCPAAVRLHPRSFLKFAASPDGRFLASAGLKRWRDPANEIMLWDATTGDRIHSLSGHGGDILSLGFSPDGKLLASGSAQSDEKRKQHSSGEVRVWNTASGKLVSSFHVHDRYVFGVAYSPDGKVLATCGQQATDGKAPPVGEVILRDAASHRVFRTIKQPGRVRCVAFSPTAPLIASVNTDGTVFLWGLSDGRLLKKLVARRTWSSFPSLVFSPDGKTLYHAGSASITAWAVGSGQLIRTIQAPEGRELTALACSPDGKWLAAGSDHRGITIWDASTGKEVLSLPTRSDTHALAFRADGKRLYASGGGAVIFLDVDFSSERRVLRAGKAAFRAVAFQEGGKRLVARSTTGELFAWDVSTGSPLGAPKATPIPDRACSHSPNGRYTATIEAGGIVLIARGPPVPRGPRAAGGVSARFQHRPDVAPGTTSSGRETW